jgi:hypothetical protein
MQRSTIGFLGALGDPQVDGGIAQRATDTGRHVDVITLAERCLVLDRLAAFLVEPGMVGPVLVAPPAAVHSQQRHQNSGRDTPLLRDPDFPLSEYPPVGDGFVSASRCVFRCNARRRQHVRVSRA